MYFIHYDNPQQFQDREKKRQIYRFAAQKYRTFLRAKQNPVTFFHWRHKSPTPEPPVRTGGSSTDSPISKHELKHKPDSPTPSQGRSSTAPPKQKRTPQTGEEWSSKGQENIVQVLFDSSETAACLSTNSQACRGWYGGRCTPGPILDSVRRKAFTRCQSHRLLCPSSDMPPVCSSWICGQPEDYAGQPHDETLPPTNIEGHFGDGFHGDVYSLFRCAVWRGTRRASVPGFDVPTQSLYHPYPESIAQWTS